MKNWQTTAVGVIGALIVALLTIQTALQNHTPINWPLIAVTFVIAALGVVAKDAFAKPDKPPTNGINTMLIAFINVGILLAVTHGTTACASTQTALVSGTLSNGDKFPLCLEVTEKSPIGGVTLLAAFCANVQADIDNKAAQYRTMYGPNVRMTELIGTEKRQLN